MFQLLRRQLHGTWLHRQPFANRLYAEYTKFLIRRLPREADSVLVEFRGRSFWIERNDITLLPTLVRGDYESQEIDCLLGLLTESTTFVDVGANIGVYSILAASHKPSPHKVIAIEPGSETVAYLKRNLQILANSNPLSAAKIEVVNAALSDCEGRGSLLRTQFLGTSRMQSKPALASTGGGSSIAGESVALTLLDSLLQSATSTESLVIKIDVEGFEPSVIRGARRTIESIGPALMCEVCGDSTARVGDDWESVLDLLAGVYSHMEVFGAKGREECAKRDLKSTMRALINDRERGSLFNVLFTI